MKLIDRKRSQEDRVAFIALAIFTVLAFLLGGGSRADSLAIPVLRPLAACFLGLGLYLHHREDWRTYRWLFVFAGSVAVLSLAHLVPLPPALWQLFPGREIVANIDEATQPGGIWRPLTLVPQEGLNALFSLVVPIAGFFLALRLSGKQHTQMVLVVLVIAAFSIVLGLLQIQGSSSGPLYFHRITNPGKLVGPFANRNHMAIFLASVIPLISYFASRPVTSTTQGRIVTALSIIGAIFVLTALLVIGSRAGFVFGSLGAMGALAIYRPPEIRRRLHSDRAPKVSMRRERLIRFGAMGVLVVLVAVVALTSKSETMSRVFQSDSNQELRAQVAGPIFDMAIKYLPFGSGIGSFVDTFKIDEPLILLDTKYLNHAHNDYLEIFLTLGLPGLILIVAGFCMLALGIRAAFKSSQTIDDTTLRARAASLTLALLALASVFDYPLRTPSLALLFVLSTVWLARGWARSRIVAQGRPDV